MSTYQYLPVDNQKETSNLVKRKAKITRLNSEKRQDAHILLTTKIHTKHLYKHI